MGTTNRAGTKLSLAISRGSLIDFSQGDFKFLDKNGNQKPFNIKNETAENIEIDGVLWDNPADLVETFVIYPGWNVEVFREIKATAGDARIRYGE
jgi:hypothetical protein